MSLLFYCVAATSPAKGLIIRMLAITSNTNGLSKQGPFCPNPEGIFEVLF